MNHFICVAIIACAILSVGAAPGKSIDRSRRELSGSEVQELITSMREEVSGVNEEMAGIKERIDGEITGIKERVDGEMAGIKEKRLRRQISGSEVQKLITSLRGAVSGINGEMAGIKEKIDRLVALTVVRLVGEDGVVNSNYGRVEVRHNGEWGTVCDDSSSSGSQSTNNIASVVCRALKGSDAGGTVYNGGYHSNHGGARIWLDNLECVGDEKSLFDCPGIFHDNGGNCAHSEDLAVACN